MKHLLLLCLLLLAIPSRAQFANALDAKNGFRDAVFGASVETLPGATPLGQGEGDTQCYSRATDELKIGDAQLSDISYCYYKGRLYSVTLATAGAANSRALRDALEAAYGRTGQSDRYTLARDWSGRVVGLSYAENPISRDATATMYSKALSKQKAADAKANAKRAKADL
ncbi:MAG: hypothetical protein H7Z21_12960 [Hymenobacter sp.]|nr:hypothetical protein [Hymenobacter sp.]